MTHCFNQIDRSSPAPSPSPTSGAADDDIDDDVEDDDIPYKKMR